MRIDKDARLFDLKSQEGCEAAVRFRGDILKKVPKEFITYEMCLDSMLSEYANQIGFKYIPEEFKTPGICEIAVVRDGYNLQYVPKENITDLLCKLAIENEGILKYVPEDMRTIEICKLAIATTNSNIFNIEWVPEQLLDDCIDEDFVSRFMEDIKSCLDCYIENNSNCRFDFTDLSEDEVAELELDMASAVRKVLGNNKFLEIISKDVESKEYLEDFVDSIDDYYYQLYNYDYEAKDEDEDEDYEEEPYDDCDMKRDMLHEEGYW